MGRFRSLVTVLYHPKETIRGILADGRPRRVVPVVVVAIVSMMLSDLTVEGLRDGLSGPNATLKTVVVVLGFAVGAAVVLGLFWLFSWLTHLAARFAFGGGASTADARAALAWGMAPVIWALVYRIPAFFLNYGSGPKLSIDDGSGWSFDPGRMSEGCAVVAVLAFLEVAVLVWWVVTSSLALAEAEGISGGKALGSIAVVAAAPVIIVIAAVLTLAF